MNVCLETEIKEKLAQGKVEAEALKKEKKSEEGGVATLEDHLANPGPVCSLSLSLSPDMHILMMMGTQVIAENLGEPASKEELKKRMEELNQKK